jgi:hypothetical protein
MAMVFIEVGDAYYLLLVMRASASRQIFHHLFFGGKEIPYLHVAVMEDLAGNNPPYTTRARTTTTQNKQHNDDGWGRQHFSNHPNNRRRRDGDDNK